ncbi:DUF934 domain-containing protein [Azoarcus sp. PA01]|nr:DUF934 domain-containing protein [Azoarcus sp. PA01]
MKIAEFGELLLIAVHFVRFTDGRGYSVARLLRAQYIFEGALRALEDVLRDEEPCDRHRGPLR